MRYLTLMLFGLMACDDGTVQDPPVDQGRIFDVGANASVDIDASPPDARVLDGDVQPIDSFIDSGLPDVDQGAIGSVDRSSPRAEPAWRVRGCGLITDGEGERVPRAVVVSADSLQRNARTPLHTAQSYVDLKRLNVDWVWLLLTWDGISPRIDTFNGAYLGRVCEQVGFAHDAGLSVVLAMHQERWGPTVGGHGAPAWATPPNLDQVPPGTVAHPSLDFAWAAFWDQPDRSAAFQAAWGRVLDTCADAEGVIGLQALAAPRGDPAEIEALTARIRSDAEARFGPLLLFVDGDHPATAAPDVIYAPTAWAGRGPSAEARDLSAEKASAQVRGMPLFIRGTAITPEALASVEAQGAGWAGWHDGFGLDALALRDEDGVIGDGGPLLRDRAWPVVVGGSLQSFGPATFEAGAAGFQMRWLADGRNAGLSIVAVPGMGEPQTELLPVGVDGFTAYDAIEGTVSVFVQGDAGAVELRIAP